MRMSLKGLSHRPITIIALVLFLAACVSEPQIAVDPSSAPDLAKYEADKQECVEVARTYALDKERKIKAGAGALLAGGTTAVVATTIGAIMAPHVALILATTAAGGGLWGNKISRKEKKARSNILIQCMESRGYTVYSCGDC